MSLPVIKSPENSLSAFWKKIPRHIVITFSAAVVIGYGVHGFVFTNKMLNHDDLTYLFGFDSGAASGRWLLDYVLKLDGQISAPWLIGTISLLLLAASVCLTVTILRIRHPVSCMLTAAIMVTFPTVSATFGYMFTASAYFLSLLLACLAAYLMTRRRPWGLAAGVLALALSMGIYQSYFAVTAVLLVASLALDVLDSEEPFKTLLLRGIALLAALVLALASYLIVVKLTTPADGLTKYMGVSSMGKIPVSQLPQLIRKAYTRYSQLYKLGSNRPISGVLPVFIGVALLASVVLSVSILLRKRLKALNLALLGVLVALFPLAGGIIYVMAPKADTHQLMLYGMCYMLLAPLAIYEYHASLPGDSKAVGLVNLSAWVMILALALVSWQYTVFNNEVYMKMLLSRDQLAAYSTRLVSAIEGSEHYSRDVEIALVYSLKTSPELMPVNDYLLNTELIGVWTAEEMLKNWTLPKYLVNYMAFPNKVYICSGNKLARELGALPQVTEMPCYPDAGCMALVDGYMVVKLSE